MIERNTTSYEAPAVTVLGTVHEVTLGATGPCADVTMAGGTPSPVAGEGCIP